MQVHKLTPIQVDLSLGGSKWEELLKTDAEEFGFIFQGISPVFFINIPISLNDSKGNGADFVCDKKSHL